MELIWNEINALSCVLRAREQTELEGSIPLPSGRSAAELIDYSAEVALDSLRTGAGRLELNGRLSAKLTAADERGEVYSFVSESPFTHTLTSPSIEAGMTADAIASLPLLEVRRAPDSSLLLSSVIDLDCLVTSDSPVRTLGGVSGVPDLELKKREQTAVIKNELGVSSVVIADELSSDGADSVLSYQVALSVRDTQFENGGVTVSGAAVVTALLKSADGELIRLVRSVPFRESVRTDGAADEVFARAVLRSSSLRALGTEFSLLGFEAEAELRVYGLKKTELSLPLDAFSPTVNFNCLKQKTDLLSELGGRNLQHTMRENLTVPEGGGDIVSVLLASARPVVTSTVIEGGELIIEGLLPTRVVYRAGSERIGSFSEEVPFTLRMAAPAGADFARVRMNCACSVTGGSGRAAQITYNLDCAAEFYSETESELAVGLAEQNAQDDASGMESFRGIVIHSTAAGEDAFDAAKRFRIPSETVRSLNPDIKEPFEEGTRLLLIV